MASLVATLERTTGQPPVTHGVRTRFSGNLDDRTGTEQFTGPAEALFSSLKVPRYGLPADAPVSLHCQSLGGIAATTVATEYHLALADLKAAADAYLQKNSRSTTHAYRQLFATERKRLGLSAADLLRACHATGAGTYVRGTIHCDALSISIPPEGLHGLADSKIAPRDAAVYAIGTVLLRDGYALPVPL